MRGNRGSIGQEQENEESVNSSKGTELREFMALVTENEMENLRKNERRRRDEEK